MSSSKSPKSLSNGTLSLRFMQNAHRAKKLQEVELEKAAVIDDAEWEVAKEIREKWAVVGSADGARETVQCETSYLPFLFSSPSDPSSSSSSSVRGRRTFNKKGEEVTSQSTEAPIVMEHQISSADDRSKRLARPTSISSHRQSKKSSAASNDNTTTATVSTFKSSRDTIFDNSGVGVDWRQAKSTQGITPPSQAQVFLKPAGIDEPIVSAQRPSHVVASESSAPRKRKADAPLTGEKKRDVDAIACGETVEKPKKKKKKKQVAED